MFKELFKSKSYNIIITILSLIVVITLFLELTLPLSYTAINLFDTLNFIIWIIFVVDYFIRFILSSNKKTFVLNNKIDLIAILPLNELLKSLRIFKALKLLKVTRLLKFMAFASKYIKKLNEFSKLNNFNYVLYITISTILIGAASISIIENMTFKDSLWWSFVTTTTVGYGDISPSTDLGRIIAIILMLVGIGFISILTGTIATFFLKNKTIKTDYKTETLENISDKIKNDFDSLTEEDLSCMFKILKSFKNE